MKRWRLDTFPLAIAAVRCHRRHSPSVAARRRPWQTSLHRAAPSVAAAAAAGVRPPPRVGRRC
jgi:hypothetical protein